MAIFKCKICGENLEVPEGGTVCECGICKAEQTVPTTHDEKAVNLFNRANRLRVNGEFDKAAGVYASITEEFPEEAEAYWGLCLCRYGVEYSSDQQKTLTCRRTLPESIFDDENFDIVCENTEGSVRQLYRNEAKKIDRLQKAFLETAKGQPNFDVFICCKEIGENGENTADNELARELYDLLTRKGLGVFFSGITLSDKPVYSREPYIYSALCSTKIMIVIGTKYEYYNDAWVKNDWSRFLAMASNGNGKTLIPCYRDIDSYDIPKEFRQLQSRDLKEAGALEKLAEDVADMISKAAAAATSVSAAEPIIKRGFLCLEDGDWNGADTCFDKILDIDPENAEAYVLKLCSDLKVTCPADIAKIMEPLDDNKNYKRAIRFGNDELKAELEGYNAAIRERIETNKYAEVYTEAKEKLKTAVFSEDYKAIREMLEPIKGYKCADRLLEQCNDSNGSKNVRANAIALKQINSSKSIGDYMDSKNFLLKMDPFNGRDELINRCNENIYLLCKGSFDHSLSDAEIKEIMIALRTISEYKDSKDIWCHLEDGALEYYNKAKTAIRNNDLQRAVQLLSYIKGFFDSDELIECCKTVIKQNDDKSSTEYKKLQGFSKATGIFNLSHTTTFSGNMDRSSYADNTRHTAESSSRETALQSVTAPYGGAAGNQQPMPVPYGGAPCYTQPAPIPDGGTPGYPQQMRNDRIQAKAGNAAAPASQSEAVRFAKGCNIYALLSMILPFFLMFSSLFTLNVKNLGSVDFCLTDLMNLNEALEDNGTVTLGQLFGIEDAISVVNILLKITIVIFAVFLVAMIIVFIVGWIKLGNGELNSAALSSAGELGIMALLFVVIANLLKGDTDLITFGLGGAGITLLVIGITNFIVGFIMRNKLNILKSQG